jgi:large subunit ribosomal protein L16
MLLQPRQFKHRKLKKRYLNNQLIETKSNFLRFGEIGLKALAGTRLTARQIESVRQCINRNLSRKGKIWITVFPSIPVTSKPTENRMGKGKGSVSYWSAPIKAGTILFEITGVSQTQAKVALLKGASKLPIPTKIVC